MITPVVSMLMIKRVNGFWLSVLQCVSDLLTNYSGRLILHVRDQTSTRPILVVAKLYTYTAGHSEPLWVLWFLFYPRIHTHTNKRARTHILTRAFLQRHFFIFPFSKSYKRKTMKNKEKKRVLKQPNNTNNKRQRQQP